MTIVKYNDKDVASEVNSRITRIVTHTHAYVTSACTRQRRGRIVAKVNKWKSRHDYMRA